MGKIILIKGADFSKVSVEKVKLIIDKFNISVFSNSEELGTVTGGGIYEEGDVVTLSAIPNTDCEFVEWDDGVTDSTRTIIAGENTKTSYTAIFKYQWTFGVKNYEPTKSSFTRGIHFLLSEEANAKIAGKSISSVFTRIYDDKKDEFVDSTGYITLTIGYCDWNTDIITNEVELIRIEEVYSNVVTEFEPITIPIDKRMWFKFSRSIAAQKDRKYLVCSQYSNNGIEILSLVRFILFNRFQINEIILS